MCKSFFAAIIVILCLHFAIEPTETYLRMHIYLLMICVFALLSLFIYYLSIIADALSRRLEDRMADETKKPENK